MSDKTQEPMVPPHKQPCPHCGKSDFTNNLSRAMHVAWHNRQKGKNKKFPNETAEHREARLKKTRIAARKMRLAKGMEVRPASLMEHKTGVQKWTVQQRKKFNATWRAKKAAAVNTGQSLAVRNGDVQIQRARRIALTEDQLVARLEQASYKNIIAAVTTAAQHNITLIREYLGTGGINESGE